MSELLGQALWESGFDSEVVRNGKDAIARAADCDLLVLDVMMPGMNGFEVARELRRNIVNKPILFLTARDSISDRVKGLDLGDDYLVKPFALEELLARVRALLRRSRNMQDVLEYADISLNRRDRVATRGEKPLSLSTTEFSVLEMFLLSPATVLPKSAILREIWNDDEARDDNIVEVYVSYVRNKLSVGGATRMIHTVRGVGYILESRES